MNGLTGTAGLGPRLACLLVVAFLGASAPAAAAPVAPAPTAPASGASVVVPFTISWTPVNDLAGIVAYNWQVSATSTFASVIMQDSTSGETQATVSGLPNGTYFWRVQAVNGSLEQGAWSPARSFAVTGAGPGEPGTPKLNPPKGGTRFHPLETITFTWSAVPGASSYVFEASKDPSFPVATRVHINNIPGTSYTLAFGDSEQGNWQARVYAVNDAGLAGVPSNTTAFSVFFNNPVGPAPLPLTPANGANVTLPVTFTWTDVPNPQPSGYELQIARDSAFSSIEEDVPQLNDPRRTVLSLTPGQKFWRVRSFQGDSSPTTAAATAWSAVRTFTVASGPPAVAAVSLTRSSPFSGDQETGDLQLTGAAPPGGAVVSLTSTDPSAVPVPSTVTVPAGVAFTQFRFQYGQVTAPTPVTVTAKLGSSSTSFALTLQPPSVKEVSISPSSITGGATVGGVVMLNGLAPAGGAGVSLSSDSPAVKVPATVTAAPGDASVSFNVQTSAVTAPTTATVTATWNGISVRSQLTLTAGQPPDTLTLDPTTTTGTAGSSGRVSVASPGSTDVQFVLESSNPAVARVPQSVTVPAFAAAGGFVVSTSAVTTPTTVTISASGGGVTKTATLTVNPTSTPTPPPTPTPTPIPGAPLRAPTLLAPAANARFAAGHSVPFDWSDVSGAGSYTIQVSTSSAFSSTVVNRTVTPSQFATSTLPKANLFWRVRALNPAGASGAWSASRAFRVG